jgi:hypothetical protein
MAYLQQLMQEFQLVPLRPCQVVPAIFLVPQSGNILTIISELCESCYCLCGNQYKVMPSSITMHLLEFQCPIQTHEHRCPLSSYKQDELELQEVDLITHLLEGVSLR